jgi:ribosomal-protein-alanine N-acetyltransferase
MNAETEIVFQTARLLARPFQPDEDAAGAFALYGDSEVTRYLSLGKVDTDIVVTTERLKRYRSVENGRGIMALVAKEAPGEIIGTILLKRLPDGYGNATAEWEVGWHLARSVWGKGYATEAGAAVLEYGFAERGLSEIFAVVDSGNEASRKVVERLQMIYQGQTERYYGQTLDLFKALPASLNL